MGGMSGISCLRDEGQRPRDRERFSGLLLERKCATLWTRVDRGSLTNDPCHERGGQSSIDFYEEQK